MSVVYRAWDLREQREVAVKLLGDAFRAESERFLREANALERLRHPAIVRYVAHGSAADELGTPWLAMEWLEGEDLAARLERGPLPLRESLLLCARVAGALAAVHGAGLVHRDIKPSNLFLAEGDTERAKVIDFGIARFADRADLTAPGIIFGTAGYMAPEQARGERRIDSSADIFALGCVLYECLTGRPVFAGAHPTAILAKVVLEDAPRLRTILPHIDEDVDRLLARLLAKVPASRPNEARGLAEELHALARTAASDAAVASLRPVSLGEHEQRLVCVVMTAGDGSRVPDQTIQLRDGLASSPPGASRFESLNTLISRYGAKLEYLRNGSLVATMVGEGDAQVLASSAARCALAMRAYEERPIVLAMGRGVLGGRVPVGAAIDRAVEMLRASPSIVPTVATVPTVPTADSKGVRIDAMLAGLLDARFDVVHEGNRATLLGENEAPDSTRTVLGRATPYVGRDRELAILRLMLDESIKERVARAALVTGAAGTGKSRLRHEFLKAVRELTRTSAPPPQDDEAPRVSRRPTVWIARGDSMSAGSPFALVAELVRQAVGMREGEPVDVRRHKIASHVAARVSAKRAQRVTLFLGEIVGARFPDDASLPLRAARQDAMLMGDQMRAAWEDLLDAESARQPVVIVLEDLHWGDLPSVQFVDAALRNLRDRPFVVLALARPEVTELFPSLWASRGVQEIRLSALTQRAADRLVRSVLGDSVEQALVDRLVERAGGNPLYLEELVRATADDGARGGRGGLPDSVPDTVVAMVQARLERLDPDARRVLRAASVFGQVFWRGGVAALLGDSFSPSDLERWLEHLVTKEVIVRRAQAKFPGESEHVFHHALVREGAYAMLTDADKKVGHALAGPWLEGVGEGDAMRLAEHYERGGEQGRAIGWYHRAAEHALEGNDFEAVVARAERAVACGAAAGTLGALRVLQAEAHRWRGDLAGAEACAMDAMRLLPRCSPHWYAAVGDLALASGRRGKTAQVVMLGQMLQDLGTVRQVSGPHAIAAARAATQLLLAGKQDLGSALVAQLARLPRSEVARNPAATARIEVARFYESICVGDVGSAESHARAAVSSFEAVGDLRGACNARGDAAYTQVELGVYDAACTTLREVVEVSERLGRLHYASASAKQNLGTALARLGALDDARVIEEEALRAFETKGDSRMAGGSRIILAEILLHAGDLEGAAEQARLAVEVLAGTPPARAHALAMTAEIELARGRPAEAMTAAAEAESILRAAVLDEGEALVRLVHALALHETGHLGEARTAIAAAEARLLERAAKIVDPELRRSFLERVPENARTSALRKAWSAA